MARKSLLGMTLAASAVTFAVAGAAHAQQPAASAKAAPAPSAAPVAKPKPQPPLNTKAMTFFVTSVGKGDGANLGGLDGADAHCAALAKAAGATATTWKAYLSTTLPGGDAGVNARDRIGKGPWRNSRGTVVARSVADLHSAKSRVTKDSALTEKGDVISGRGDAVNMHDVLTGSDPDGHYSTAGGDTTCGNWTKNADGSAIVGHHDRIGLKPTRHMTSWNSSHGSAGCSQDALKKTGGAGLFYCFAAGK